MTSIPQPVNEQPASRRQEYTLPQVILFNQKQWQYLKDRYRMTERELQIAQRICRGLSNDQIAADLQIMHGTVKTHMRNMYRKLWVRNKVSLLLRFIEETNNHCPA